MKVKESENIKRPETQGLLTLLILLIIGWLTIVISFWKGNFTWFVIGNIVIGLVGLTAYHILKRGGQKDG